MNFANNSVVEACTGSDDQARYMTDWYSRMFCSESWRLVPRYEHPNTLLRDRYSAYLLQGIGSEPPYDWRAEDSLMTSQGPVRMRDIMSVDTVVTYMACTGDGQHVVVVFGTQKMTKTSAINCVNEVFGVFS